MHAGGGQKVLYLKNNTNLIKIYNIVLIKVEYDQFKVKLNRNIVYNDLC